MHSMEDKFIMLVLNIAWSRHNEEGDQLQLAKVNRVNIDYYTIVTCWL